LPGPEADLALLDDAAREAGVIAMRYWKRSPRVSEKPDGQGPVSEADLAMDAALQARLTGARPRYGWLSEETPDTPARLDCRSVFVVDPLDGTRAFLAGEDAFAVSLALVTDGVPVAAVVHLPAQGRTYAALAAGPAMLNGQSLSGPPATPAPRFLASRPTLSPEHWPGGLPEGSRHFRPSLAWRLCLVAEGQFDAMLTLRPTWEWDIAAGALIAERAGVTVTDRDGRALAFNRRDPRAPGCIAAPPGLHANLMARRRGKDPGAAATPA
jgi:myo-inositol-1(or 4)-monophosphatase